MIFRIILIASICYSTVFSASLLQMLGSTSYKVNSEKVTVSWLNKSQLTSARIKIFKYNKTTVAVNGFINSKKIINTAEASVLVYKQENKTEYVKTYLQGTLDLCKLILDESFGFGALKSNGNFTDCPIKKGISSLRNSPLEINLLPPNMGVGKYKAEVKVIMNSIYSARAFWYFNVIEKK